MSKNRISNLDLPKDVKYNELFLYENESLDLIALSNYIGNSIGIIYNNDISNDMEDGFHKVIIVDVPNDKRVNLQKN